ncbi:MAG: exonuclease SbcCD subunit D [Marinifilaceae bacterium]
MRILHTADWHIGQNFHDYDRKEEHLLFFDWLIETIKEQHIDVMLVAGDIFDTPNPSAESQHIFYRFLTRVSHSFPKLHVIIVAGNHDSAARLEAPNPLLENMNIIIRGVVKRIDKDIDWDRHVVNIDNKLIVLAVPYLRQGDYPNQPSLSAISHHDGVENFYKQLIAYVRAKYGEAIPIVAMGHLQAIGAHLSEQDKSERIIIGGLEAVSSGIFKEQTVYTALGHLHKAQQIGGNYNIQYCGTPLPMSFAEINYKHGVNIIDINKDSVVTRCEYINPVPLLSIPAKGAEPIDKIIELIGELPEGQPNGLSPFLEINVLNDGPDPTRRQRINEALLNKAVRLTATHAINIKKDTSSTKATETESLDDMTPQQLALRVYKDKYQTDMPTELQVLLNEAIYEAEHTNTNR